MFLSLRDEDKALGSANAIYWIGSFELILRIKLIKTEERCA